LAQINIIGIKNVKKRAAHGLPQGQSYAYIGKKTTFFLKINIAEEPLKISAPGSQHFSPKMIQLFINGK